MGAFARAARCEGWSKAEINTVLADARRGDYNNLLRVLVEHCEAPEELEEA